MLWVFKVGVFLVLAGILLALYTSNLLGFSKKQNDAINRLKTQRDLDASERSYLKYVALNNCIRTVSAVSFGAGVLLILVGLIL